MKSQRIKIGDYYVIPLSDGRNAFGQYIYWDEKYGPLSRIFDYLTEKILKPVELPASFLFPPVYIGFGSIFETGHWQIIGSLPVQKFNFPKFRFVLGGQPGRHRDWKIYNGKKFVEIGDLSQKYRALEFLCGWSPQSIEKRIITGKNRYDRLF